MTGMVAFRIAALVLSVAGILIWVVWADYYKNRWRIAVAPLTWLANVAAFYVCYFSMLLRDDYNLVFLNNWSLVIRLQSLIYVIGAAILLWDYERKQ